MHSWYSILAKTESGEILPIMDVLEVSPERAAHEYLIDLVSEKQEYIGRIINITVFLNHEEVGLFKLKTAFKVIVEDVKLL